MPRRRNGDGFDYFVDRYDNIYDDFEDTDYIPGDRFSKRNRYTSEKYGHKPTYVNTSSIYTYQNPQQGTLEFSALPGQGGLNPNQRPLGDQTLMMNVDENIGANPFIKKMIEVQATQQVQLDSQKEAMEAGFDNLTKKLDILINSSTNETALPQRNQALITPQRPIAQPQRPIAQPQPKKKKMSKGVLIGGIIGIIIAIGLIVLGALMITGVIQF